MCLSIPSEVIEIDGNNVATVDTMGIKRKVSLDLIAERVNIGDYILIHVGFAMSRIDKENALESLKIYRKMIEIMETEEGDHVNKAL
ncbi:MAG: hydrogenase formation protein [bacterium]|nr:MAG: hydrogenase formation protein [bacterium]